MIAAAAAGCAMGVPIVDGVPGAAPAFSPSAISAPASPNAVPTLSARTPTDEASAPSTPDVTPRRAWPSYPPATEPPCAIPHAAPTAVAGADGPRLTVKRVAEAWRASPTGKSLGVKTGRVQAGAAAGAVLPGSVLDEPGLAWAELNTIEWSGIRTYVLSDQTTAVQKIATIRRMLAQPCSFKLDSLEPAVALSLTLDEPDCLLASGVMNGLPFGQLFIRFGNTVTEQTGVLVSPNPGQVAASVRAVLAKA